MGRRGRRREQKDDSSYSEEYESDEEYSSEEDINETIEKNNNLIQEAVDAYHGDLFLSRLDYPFVRQTLEDLIVNCPPYGYFYTDLYNKYLDPSTFPETPRDRYTEVFNSYLDIASYSLPIILSETGTVLTKKKKNCIIINFAHRGIRHTEKNFITLW